MFARVLWSGLGLGLLLVVGCGKSADSGPAGAGGRAATGGGAGSASGGLVSGGAANAGAANGAAPNGASAGGGAANGGFASGSAANGGAGQSAAGGYADAGAAPEGGSPHQGLVDCDARKIVCKRLAPPCDAMQVPSVEGTCYGECVPIDRCACALAAECPDNDQYTCWMSKHCGPYVQ
jgi:hypothetical protein